jgi:hypothetical protein
MKILCGLCLLVLLASCGPKEDLPVIRTSSGLNIDGSRNVALTGTVNELGQTTEIDQSVAPEGWSTAPIPLAKPLGFAIATRNGKIMIYDDRDSLKQTVTLGDSIVIDQLLTANGRIIAVGLQGTIHAINTTGKLLWQNATSQQVTSNVILSDKRLYVPCGKALYLFNALTGAPEKTLSFSLDVHSLAYSTLKNALVLATTRNQAGAEDSLFVLNPDGNIQHKHALPQTRLTSNIALVGDEGIAYGYLGALGGPQRASAVDNMRGLFEGKLTKVWTQTVPYVIGNVAVNDEDVIVGGIREQGELTSGIDAFRLDDTIHTWSRRFTEPLVAPFGVSEHNVYLHLSFRSDAIVDTRGIFYTLDSRTGKTLRSQSIPGAEDGFLSHIPMPDERGRFLLADRARLIVYLLDRSSFERVFK